VITYRKQSEKDVAKSSHKEPFPLRPYYPTMLWGSGISAATGALVGAFLSTSNLVLRWTIFALAISIGTIGFFGTMYLWISTAEAELRKRPPPESRGEDEGSYYG